jgi:hypothetical protein
METTAHAFTRASVGFVVSVSLITIVMLGLSAGAGP